MPQDFLSFEYNILCNFQQSHTQYEVLTMHFGPSDILLNLSLDFKNDISAGDVEDIISKFEMQIKEIHPEIKRIFIEAQSRRDHIKDAMAE